MCNRKYCYSDCIPSAYLMSDKLAKQVEEIIKNLPIKATTGRPSTNVMAALHGIYFLLRTGIQWGALPKCFGDDSAIHRMLIKLKFLGFFEKLWHKELVDYEQKHGLELSIQSSDCSQIKAPLGGDKTGPSPVDRAKLGTKRSIVVTKKGIPISLLLAPANRHDSILLYETIKAIPSCLSQPYCKEIELDAAYDSEYTRTMLFNVGYIGRISKNKHKKHSFESLFSKARKNIHRWVVESTHSWMNRFRRLLVRFEKSADNYKALCHFAFSVIIFNKIGV